MLNTNVRIASLEMEIPCDVYEWVAYIWMYMAYTSARSELFPSASQPHKLIFWYFFSLESSTNEYGGLEQNLILSSLPEYISSLPNIATMMYDTTTIWILLYVWYDSKNTEDRSTTVGIISYPTTENQSMAIIGISISTYYYYWYSTSRDLSMYLISLYILHYRIVCDIILHIIPISLMITGRGWNR